jgi:hypothetical protein
MRYFFFLQIQMSISQKFYPKKCVNCRDTTVGYFRCNSSGIDPGKIGNRNDSGSFSFTRDGDCDAEQHPKKNADNAREPICQSGVLRTNCIDCLDRTLVAQFAYGLEALGRQLYAMGLSNGPKVDLDSGIAATLMEMYQSMGDALAIQYGGSALGLLLYV